MRQNDDGFTLLELAVVVLVLGVLVFLAVPTLFGSRERAGDRQAQVTARLGHRAQQVHQTGGAGERTFTTSPEHLAEAESSITFEPAPAEPAPAEADPTEHAEPHTAFVQTTPDEDVTCISSVSPTGKVFSIMDDGTGRTFFREGRELPVCADAVGATDGWQPERW